jgi:hypothetical protein
VDGLASVLDLDDPISIGIEPEAGFSAPIERGTHRCRLGGRRRRGKPEHDRRYGEGGDKRCRVPSRVE